MRVVTYATRYPYGLADRIIVPMTIPPFLKRVRGAGAMLIGLLLVVLSATGSDGARAQGADDGFVERVLASLTPNERVGQLVMVNFVGDDVSAASDIGTLIRDYNVGAVLVTSSNGNIVNRDDTAAQLAALTNGLQQRSFDASRRSDTQKGEYFLPLYVATDSNEGRILRVTPVR